MPGLELLRHHLPRHYRAAVAGVLVQGGGADQPGVGRRRSLHGPPGRGEPFLRPGSLRLGGPTHVVRRGKRGLKRTDASTVDGGRAVVVVVVLDVVRGVVHVVVHVVAVVVVVLVAPRGAGGGAFPLGPVVEAVGRRAELGDLGGARRGWPAPGGAGLGGDRVLRAAVL